MKIVYLPRTREDAQWLRRYYGAVFPAGAASARAHLRAAERLVTENPFIGRPTGVQDARELPIGRTPFSLIYRVSADRLEVLRIWDGRADRAALDWPEG